MAHYMEKEWLDIVAQQEEALCYSEFTRDTALELGLEIVRLAREVYGAPAAVRIVEDGYVIFAHKMAGTNSENDWWMNRKLAVTRLAGVSSIRAALEIEYGRRVAPWTSRGDNLALCGGCFPVRMRDGSPTWAFVLVSGLNHYEDHQLIADAMALQLGVNIPRLTVHE